MKYFLKYFSTYFFVSGKNRASSKTPRVQKNGAEKLAVQSGIRRGRSTRFCVFAAYIRARDKKIFFFLVTAAFFYLLFSAFPVQ